LLVIVASSSTQHMTTMWPFPTVTKIRTMLVNLGIIQKLYHFLDGFVCEQCNVVHVWSFQYFIRE
jgi:hypothetical protein